jgi:hypothetical protein
MKRLLIMFNIKYPSEIMELSISPIEKLIHMSLGYTNIYEWLGIK